MGPLAARIGPITSRRMFGGHALYYDGLVFALVLGGRCFLKVDDRTRARFQGRGRRAVPLQPCRARDRHASLPERAAGLPGVGRGHDGLGAAVRWNPRCGWPTRPAERRTGTRSGTRPRGGILWLMATAVTATFRFYEELNDFLPRRSAGWTASAPARAPPPSSYMIEALGVPHTEVELILVNGESCGFERLLQDGDRVSVYPKFEAFDVTPRCCACAASHYARRASLPMPTWAGWPTCCG
ncbi:TfoX/Sxy family protein [Cupriavidus basilensis]